MLIHKQEVRISPLDADTGKENVLFTDIKYSASSLTLIRWLTSSYAKFFITKMGNM